MPTAGSPVTPIPRTLKLVKDAVTLIQGAELTPQVVVDLERRGERLSNGHQIVLTPPWDRWSWHSPEHTADLERWDTETASGSRILRGKGVFTAQRP